MTKCFKFRLKERTPFLNGHMRYVKNLKRTRKYLMYPIRTMFRNGDVE